MRVRRDGSQGPSTGFRLIISSQEFDHWRAKIQQSLGDANIDPVDAVASGFHAEIAIAEACGLQFVLLSGDVGALRLQRWQSNDWAVLWLPIRGFTQELINAHTSSPLEARPGQGMLLAPGDRLDGFSAAGTTGLSIRIPRFLVDQLAGDGLISQALNPFRIARRTCEVELLRCARQCLDDAHRRSDWLEHSAAKFWTALQDHALALELARSDRCIQSISRECAERSSAHQTADRYLNLVANELQSNPRAPFSLEWLSLQLHVAPRTLQLHLQQELLATPRQVWTHFQQLLQA